MTINIRQRAINPNTATTGQAGTVGFPAACLAGSLILIIQFADKSKPSIATAFDDHASMAGFSVVQSAAAANLTVANTDISYVAARKTADGGEQNFTVNHSTGSVGNAANRIVALEIEGDWSLIDAATTNSGTTSVSSQATGNSTATLTGLSGIALALCAFDSPGGPGGGTGHAWSNGYSIDRKSVV